MALTADRDYETSGLAEKLRVLLTASDIYYKGAIINFGEADGLGLVASDALVQGSTSGVMTKHVEVGAETDHYAEIEVGKIWIPDANAVQADVGDYCYATDDDTIAKAAANADPCGMIVDVRVGVAWLVDFRKGIHKQALV